MRFLILAVYFSISLISQTISYAISLNSGVTKFSVNSNSNLNRSVNAVIRDLEYFIPVFMAEQRIPGLAIGLIREHQLVWTRGFGVKNVITGDPVTPETIFEVASNSKVVTAYIALCLVNEDKLALDVPLNRYLAEPWLPVSPYQDIITMRQVISHSSGLGHNTTKRENIFPPGEGYFYSAIGFNYLQAVIEHVTGKSLEELARQYVFTPLNMSSSSFINQKDHELRFASGHIHAIVPVLIFIILFGSIFIVLLVPTTISVRLIFGNWRASIMVYRVLLLICFFITIIGSFILLGKFQMIQFAWLTAFCAVIISLIFVLIYHAGRFLIFSVSKNVFIRKLSLIFWTPIILILLVFLSSKIVNVPVPKSGIKSANAAASMHSNISDLSRFLIEFSRPEHLSEKLATEIKASQVKLSHDLAWGLGAGIFHSPHGDVLWQWGQHLHFQSIMMIYPVHGLGVIVFTNNDLLNPDVAFRVAQRALGVEMEPVRQAIHLEFNYQKQTN